MRVWILILPIALILRACPASAAPIAGSDGAPMVHVSAGEFIMGSENGREDEKPRRRVYLEEFYIDKYPVTNEKFARFVESSGYVTDTKKIGGEARRFFSSEMWMLKKGSSWKSPAGPGSSYRNRMKHPVVQISWNDAAAYCRWAGKRLPTEAEWEKAARGTDGLKYAWGNSWVGSKLIWSRNSGSQVHSVERSYNTHKSPYGAVDMAGNTWEWVQDWYKKDYYWNAPKSNPKGPNSGKRRVMRGGSWYDAKTRYFRAANRNGINPGGGNLSRGFRCANDALGSAPPGRGDSRTTRP